MPSPSPSACLALAARADYRHNPPPPRYSGVLGAGAAAIAEGRFDRSLVAIHHDDGRLALDKDEHPRPGTTLADLAKLAPSFAGMGGYTPSGRDMEGGLPLEVPGTRIPAQSREEQGGTAMTEASRPVDHRSRSWILVVIDGRHVREDAKQGQGQPPW